MAIVLNRKTVLEATGVCIERNRREVVSRFDLELKPGSVTALLGPNGAGKSTLLEAIAGLRPASAGTMTIYGRVAASNQVAALARRTALANVEAALGWWGVQRAARREPALATLKQLGVGELAGRDATRLSGGEARRVHLARTLAVEAGLTLLDEPFAGLDARTRADLLHDLGPAIASSERATLVVVHDRSEALAIADRMVVMIAGHKVAEGTPIELLERPPSIEVAEFLGYDGRLRRDGGVLLTRPGQVALDPSGAVEAKIERVIPVEDGTRLELASAEGRLVARGPVIAPAVGSTVRVAIEGGAWFKETLSRRARP